MALFQGCPHVQSPWHDASSFLYFLIASDTWGRILNLCQSDGCKRNLKKKRNFLCFYLTVNKSEYLQYVGLLHFSSLSYFSISCVCLSVRVPDIFLFTIIRNSWCVINTNLFSLFCRSWDLCCPACGILVPQSEIEAMRPTLGGQGLNRWITSDVSRIPFRQVSSPKLYPSINFVKQNFNSGVIKFIFFLFFFLNL